MCGIVAVFGAEKAEKKVLNGLKNLEYRGYDSWGIAGKKGDQLFIQKEIGKISAATLSADFPETKIAIGHTRWATHGGVTPENAHPHFSEDRKIAVVMNGIIENFAELRSELRARGHLFSSDTDTEVLPHLIEEFLTAGDDLKMAVKKAAEKGVGRFSFAVLFADFEKIIAVRAGSPIILGVGEKNSFFLASDTPAFSDFTEKIKYIDDGEMVEISKNGAEFFEMKNLKKIEKREIQLENFSGKSEKGDHEHFMIKEIFEQKETIARAIDQNENEILKIADAIKKARGTYLIGCGTAHKVAAAGEYFFAEIAGKHINTAVASEFPIFHKFLRPESLVIAISQSGETADVIEAIEAAKKADAKVLSIVNAENSTIARASDFSLKINAGVEKAVASTKAATSQLAVLMLLAFASIGKIADGKKLLRDAAAQINDLLNPRFVAFVEKIAKKIAKNENIFIIGKGANFPMAREAAIKIQEVSYIHAEGFAGGELKHGPIAMIEKGTPTIVLGSENPQIHREILSNAIEIKARGGKIIGIAAENSDIFDDWIRVPSAGAATPILNLIPIQVLAYFLAIFRGKNPDMPRNLAKSVTVK